MFRVFFKFCLDFFCSLFLKLPFLWIINSEMHEQSYLIDCILCYLSLSSVILHVVKSDFKLCHSYSFWMVNFSLSVTQMGNYFKAWIPANNCSGIKLISKVHTTSENTKKQKTTMNVKYTNFYGWQSLKKIFHTIKKAFNHYNHALLYIWACKIAHFKSQRIMRENQTS